MENRKWKIPQMWNGKELLFRYVQIVLSNFQRCESFRFFFDREKAPDVIKNSIAFQWKQAVQSATYGRVAQLSITFLVVVLIYVDGILHTNHVLRQFVSESEIQKLSDLAEEMQDFIGIPNGAPRTFQEFSNTPSISLH